MKLVFLVLLYAISSCHAQGHMQPIHFADSSKPAKETRLSATTAATTTKSPKSFVVSDKPKCLRPDDDARNPCEEDVEYDEEIQQRFMLALKNTFLVDEINSVFTGLIGDDILSNEISKSSGAPVVTRIAGEFVSETPVCKAIEKIIYPKRGQTENQEYVFLLNQPEGMQQGIRVEECLRENSPCSIGIDSGINSVCRQKYIFKKMLAMDRTGTRIAPESILVPSCCTCYSKEVFPRIGRSNSSVQPQPPQPSLPEIPLNGTTLSFPSNNETNTLDVNDQSTTTESTNDARNLARSFSGRRRFFHTN